MRARARTHLIEKESGSRDEQTMFVGTYTGNTGTRTAHAIQTTDGDPFTIIIRAARTHKNLFRIHIVHGTCEDSATKNMTNYFKRQLTTNYMYIFYSKIIKEKTNCRPCAALQVRENEEEKKNGTYLLFEAIITFITFGIGNATNGVLIQLIFINIFSNINL